MLHVLAQIQTCSMQVFAEIYRVLKPEGVCIMSFSNRMFYTKVSS